MSKQAITRVLAVYLGIAAVVSAIWLLATPGMFGWRWAAIIGSFGGYVIFLFFGSAFFPLLFWAFGRFRQENAGGPIMSWGLLGVILALLATAGNSYDETIKFAVIPQNVASFFENDYETFIRVVKTSCVETRNRNSTDRQTGLSDAAFAAFCQCYAEALLKELTVQEFRIALDARVTVNPPPAWMREKTGRAAIACRSLAVSH